MAAQEGAVRGYSNMSGGLKVPPFISQKVIDELFSDFPLSSSDLIIASYPKSGTTWAQNIINLLTGGEQVSQEQLERTRGVYRQPLLFRKKEEWCVPLT